MTNIPMISAPDSSLALAASVQHGIDREGDSELATIPLTELRAGDQGRLHAVHLVTEDRELLHALGLAGARRFRVCKAGDPWILQVQGTRVGIADAVAEQILVIPESPPVAEVAVG